MGLPAATVMCHSLGRAMAICAGALALQLEAYVLAAIFLAVGVLALFSGLGGAGFNGS